MRDFSYLLDEKLIYPKKIFWKYSSGIVALHKKECSLKEESGRMPQSHDDYSTTWKCHLPLPRPEYVIGMEAKINLSKDYHLGSILQII